MARYPAVLRRSWIGWREGGVPRCLPACLLDLAQGGCRAEVLEHPGPCRPVVLRLDGELLPHWFEARLTECAPAPIAGHFRLRLTFPGGCPYPLFMAVVYGRATIDVARHVPDLPAWVYPEPAREPFPRFCRR
jgi:hypothetical protein